jgi:transmembrane sensor
MSEPKQMMSADSHEAIEVRAADFLQRRRLLRWTDADRAELDAWLDEATSHRVAYLRLEESEALIERVSDLRPVDLDRLTAKRHRGFILPFLAIAASLGLIAMLGLAAERYFLQPVDRTYATEVGGRALLRFADRTQIELNTDTVVRYRMTTQERTVWLDKGEAWFRVSHDAKNPFTVIVGNHRVTDLGTEFLVRSDPGRLEVALLKGRAQLSTVGDRPQFATLVSGDEAVATPVSLSFARKTPQQLADELAWQRGVLVFRQTRLADAVNEVNRYSRIKLVIDDPAVAGTTIGGEFDSNSLDGFLQAMQTVLRLRVVREGNEILISRVAEKTKRAARVTHSE